MARQDRRFSDRFLFVTPGITVRDRLWILKPSDPDNVYAGMGIVPPDLVCAATGDLVVLARASVAPALDGRHATALET